MSNGVGRWFGPNGDGGRISTWLIQKGIYVIILAAVFWLQLHFAAKRDFDDYKAEQLRQQLELNRVLHDVDLKLKEITDDHRHDSAIDVDHEARLRRLEEKR
jgi:hypothetical protein